MKNDFQEIKELINELIEISNKQLNNLNEEVEKPITSIQQTLNDDEDRKANSLEKVDEEEKKSKGLFGDLL